jgi:hypothetical protein
MLQFEIRDRQVNETADILAGQLTVQGLLRTVQDSVKSLRFFDDDGNIIVDLTAPGDPDEETKQHCEESVDKVYGDEETPEGQVFVGDDGTTFVMPGKLDEEQYDPDKGGKPGDWANAIDEACKRIKKMEENKEAGRHAARQRDKTKKRIIHGAVRQRRR